MHPRDVPMPARRGRPHAGRIQTRAGGETTARDAERAFRPSRAGKPGAARAVALRSVRPAEPRPAGEAGPANAGPTPARAVALRLVRGVAPRPAGEARPANAGLRPARAVALWLTFAGPWAAGAAVPRQASASGGRAETAGRAA